MKIKDKNIFKELIAKFKLNDNLELVLEAEDYALWQYENSKQNILYAFEYGTFTLKEAGKDTSSIDVFIDKIKASTCNTFLVYSLEPMSESSYSKPSYTIVFNLSLTEYIAYIKL
jgi:hypothetical protein